MGAGGGGGAMRSFVGAIVVVCFLWLLVVEIVASDGTISRTPTPTTKTTRGSLRSLDVIPIDTKHVAHLHNPDLNYMNKRKVPNGPDPIHNRRTGKSGQSPGRA